VIIGLGYVGLPLACLAFEKGWQVFGLDQSASRVLDVRRRISPFRDPLIQRWLRRADVRATTDPQILRKADVIVVCVPTPVDAHYRPDLRSIVGAARDVARNLRRGQTVIVESTVNPGVCEDVVMPILRTSGLSPERDFFLAHCPERIDPGNADWNVRNIPRVLGATGKKSKARALAFYRSILEAPVRPMASLREAEAVKIMENAFRDINIAFVNEMAMSFERLGIDTVDVIRGASTKPFAFLPHYPSAGVGGHCIPVDPYYLIERARSIGFNHKFLKLARSINNGMPAHVLKRLEAAARQAGMKPGKLRVGILGLAYKRNIADIRESPTLRLMDLLKRRRIQYAVFDPLVPEKSSLPSLNRLLAVSNVVILMTDHDVFRKVRPAALRRHRIRVLIDGKNMYNRQIFEAAGILYRGIGR